MVGFSANVEVDGDGVTFVDFFGFAHAGFNGDDVAVVFGEEGGGPGGFADAGLDGDHAPAVGDEGGYVFEVAALFGGHGDEVPGGGAFPVPDFAGELDVHWESIADAIGFDLEGCNSVECGVWGVACGGFDGGAS